MHITQAKMTISLIIKYILYGFCCKYAIYYYRSPLAYQSIVNLLADLRKNLLTEKNYSFTYYLNEIVII